MKTLRLAGVVRESIVDGPGIRMTIFSQGCPHHCKGCHNPETHDQNGGYISHPENILNAIDQNPLLQGVTFSGGEPFVQAEAFAKLGEEIKKRGLHIATYSGYTFEEILSNIEKGKNGWKELLSVTDLLIDGRFILEERSLNLLFRGSKNQRLIDVKKSLEKGEAVLWDPEEDSGVLRYKK
ncbi:MAG: anaerobic ribonucleoside-triphosphate reductase activating protein [Oscillospiraceae bacterium]|nr:anaerobic ribonucleoside-triphosphate reductase activating protein [Oscillospiraceae bacterium]